MANRYSHGAIDDLIILNELQEYTQPYSTGVSQFFPSEQEFEENRLARTIEREGSIRQTPYMQTTEGQQTLMDIAMGSAFPSAPVGTISSIGKGGVSILKSLLGKMKSKKKFPVGYGQAAKPPQTAADDALQTLKDLNLTGKVPKPPINPVYDKIAKLDKSTRKKLSEAKLSTTLPERKFDWSKEEWQKFSDITGISLDELIGEAIDWSTPKW